MLEPKKFAGFFLGEEGREGVEPRAVWRGQRPLVTQYEPLNLNRLV